ncbi:MAG: hypothetical protein KDB07_05430 [Planctomycetes bacterium]|nr:hypothetical protein [Planctomycetota bacterium]
MTLIVTHPHIDLDAASCVGLYLLSGEVELQDVRFLSGAVTVRPPGLEDAVFVDHPLGTKGELSALAELPHAVEVLGEDYVAEVDQHDGEGAGDPRFPLARIFAALRVALRARGFTGPHLDRQLLEYWTLLLEGIASQEQNRREATQYLDTVGVPIVQTGPYRWAVPSGALISGAGNVLAERGVTGYVYEAPYGLGVYRYQQQAEPDLNDLRDLLPGWFIHKRGFMACWGSRKAPRAEHPPLHTPQAAWELVEVLRRAYT